MKQYVVMVAGGTGTRMRRTTAKQFLNVKGLPLMWWTLRRFREALRTPKWCLCCTTACLRSLPRWNKRTAPRVHKVVAGGAERFHSVAHGLAQLPTRGGGGARRRPAVSLGGHHPHVFQDGRRAWQRGACGAREGQPATGPVEQASVAVDRA